MIQRKEKKRTSPNANRTPQRSAKKKAHQRIEEREKERERLEFGQRVGKIGTYEWDLLTNTSYWTKEFEALYGYPDGGYKAGNTDEWLKYIHPDDHERIIRETELAIEKADDLTLEYRVIWPDNTIHYIDNRAQILRENGKAIRMVGVNIDITDRKVIENNLFYLSEASKILSSSLDYKTTLTNVAHLAVPQIADWCGVTIKNGNTLEQLTVAHRDPQKVLWAKSQRAKSSRNSNSKTGVYHVLRTGKPELYTHITDTLLREGAENKEELAMLRKLQMSSLMIVPLLHDGQAMGAITFIAAESGRHYSEKDLQIAEEVASRMALAITNAKLYEDARHADEMQKKLVAVVESTDDAIISTDKKGIISSWNTGAHHLYGYTANEMIGKHVSLLTSPEKRDDFSNIMKQLQKGKKVEHYETSRMTKDKRVLDVSLTVSPIRDDTGAIIGISKVARDITEQKREEQRQNFLERATAVLGASIDYETTLKNLGKILIPDLADYCRIVVLDEEKNIKEITINAVNRKLLPLVKKLYDAYRDDPANTAGIGRLMETGDAEMMREISPKLLAKSNQRVQSIVNEIGLTSYIGVPLKIGKRVVGAITLSSIRRDKLFTKSDLALAEELGRRAALAIDNAQLYAESQKAVKLRDEFISVASHELKTPITSLKMFVQVRKRQLEERKDDTHYLEKMDAQINKLTLLIQDLLNVSKFQSGKLEYHDDSFDMNELIREIVDTIQPTTQKHIITIEGQVDQPVWGDKDRIGQVVSNLLTNAIKYSPTSNKVVITVKPTSSSAVISVQDFGIGIDKKHFPKVFDRFYRVSDKEGSTFPGLGLGLYISNEIVKRYGGEIQVLSEKGKGSTFSFSLPYASTVTHFTMSV